MSRSKLISLSDSSRVGDVRREAAIIASELSFKDTAAGRVGIVATELANNLRKHAREGQILLRCLEEGTVKGIEILSIDKGPGMTDVAKCLQDGYSTAGSPGTGLGAIVRLAADFDVYSQPERGTVLVARLWSGSPPAKRSRVQLGAVCIPALEDDISGDAWSVRHGSECLQLLLADGLGHGVHAAKAADQAVRVFDEQPNRSPAELVRSMHDPLRSTRGASLAIAEIDYARSQVRYSGVGNISGVILDEKDGRIVSRSMISHNGTVGHEIRNVAEFSYPWSAESTLVMHSDGLLSRWKLDGYPGLLNRDPAIIAGIMFRDFVRGRDDASVLVVRSGKRPVDVMSH